MDSAVSTEKINDLTKKLEDRIQLQVFKDRYCDTLKRNNNTKSTYLELQVDSYTELDLFKHYINRAVMEIGRTSEDNNIDDGGFIIYYLAKLLDRLSICSEIEGIDQLFEGS